jgi:cell division protein FtsB
MLSKQFIIGVVLPAVAMFWAATIIYSAVAGNAGYGALARLEAEVDAKAGEVDVLRAHRETLQKRADQLNSKSLDPDLVDETIRTVLGYSREGDVVISRQALDDALRRRTDKPN